ncbi:MAG: asparagine synthase (glutamine-hydrolyzing) [Candidatus Latescibacterota bacterium]|nr:MAG: asparagine synthase (glutamine-hydrolyzing) [Candidatus Latescibacterota bacterium]
MCGICGQYNFGTREPADPRVIERMARTLRHRGPDDEGYYQSGELGLGFRRLSIIDLAGGHQPMSDPGERVWVILNGEIYNFPELRRELEGFGHTFRTKADTEVVVHGYKQWGLDVLEHLNGMFGVAIWDDEKKLLMIARDRMGIKPLYYSLSDKQLTFGSEIRAILSRDETFPGIDPVGLNLFLQYRYAPSPRTVFRGIQKLAPGTRLVVQDGSARVERWWNFRPVPFDPMPSAEQAIGELLDRYKRSVKRQLISDVPLGLLLSGGVDSGLLLALMNLYGSSWKTFSIGFGAGFKDDELGMAARTAEIMGAPNYPVEIDRGTFEESMPTIISALEEPVAASSVIPMYHLCRRAREEVKVVLVGQGPDELFGGYLRHLGVRYGAWWRGLPVWARGALGGALSHLPRNETIKRALYSLDHPSRMRRYQHVFSLTPGESMANLFRDGLLPKDASDKILECWRDMEPLMDETDELGGFQFLEIRSSLPDELLMYGDKLSMAHGLEARVPFLDQEIVEYVERLSASFKVRHWSRKWLHRQVSKRFVPSEILRRKKLGFFTPVDEWFRDSVASKMDATLTEDDSMIFEYLRPAAVKALAEDHRVGKSDNSKILFSIVVLEEWLQNFAS